MAGRRRAYINQTLVLVQGVTTLERTKRRKETTERKKQLRKDLRKVRKGSRNTRREIETTFLSFFRFFSLFTNSPARYAKCRLIVTLVGKVCFPRSCYKDVTKDKLSQSDVETGAPRWQDICYCHVWLCLLAEACTYSVNYETEYGVCKICRVCFDVTLISARSPQHYRHNNARIDARAKRLVLC